MALAITNSATSNTFGGAAATTQTFSFDCTGGTLLVVMLGALIQSTSTFASCTYNGVAMTSTYNNGDNSGSNKFAIFYLLSPVSGSNNIVVTYSDTTRGVIGAVAFTGNKVTSPIGANGSQANSIGSTTATFSSTVANSYLIDAFAGNTPGGTTTSPQFGETALYNIANGSNSYGGSYKALGAIGSQSTGWGITVAFSTTAYAEILPAAANNSGFLTFI